MAIQQTRNKPYYQQTQQGHASIPFDAILQTATFNHPTQHLNVPPLPASYKHPQLHQQPQYHLPIQNTSSHMAIDQKHSNVRNQVIKTPRNPGPPLPPQRRVQYIPYEERYVEYVEQRVRVPVQRMMTDYYQVQHIIDYVPIEKADIVYVTQPQEIVNMKLQYVPVQQRIIHMKEQDAVMFGLDQPNNAPTPNSNPQKPPETYNYISKSKTNFVTAEGFDPNQKLKQIDRVLAASAVRESRVKKAPSREQSVAGSSIKGSFVGDMKKRESIYDAISGLNELAKHEGSGKGSLVEDPKKRESIFDAISGIQGLAKQEGSGKGSLVEDPKKRESIFDAISGIQGLSKQEGQMKGSIMDDMNKKESLFDALSGMRNLATVKEGSVRGSQVK